MMFVSIEFTLATLVVSSLTPVVALMIGNDRLVIVVLFLVTLIQAGDHVYAAFHGAGPWLLSLSFSANMIAIAATVVIAGLGISKLQRSKSSDGIARDSESDR